MRRRTAETATSRREGRHSECPGGGKPDEHLARHPHGCGGHGRSRGSHFPHAPPAKGRHHGRSHPTSHQSLAAGATLTSAAAVAARVADAAAAAPRTEAADPSSGALPARRALGRVVHVAPKSVGHLPKQKHEHNCKTATSQKLFHRTHRLRPKYVLAVGTLALGLCEELFRDHPGGARLTLRWPRHRLTF